MRNPIPAVFCLCALTLCAADPIYLGVLDGSSVRVAFRFANGHWEGMPRDVEDIPHLGRNYPRTVNWTVAIDGRNLGSISTAQPPHFKDRTQLGLQSLTSGVPPRIARGDAYFGPLLPPYRPLAVVSQPNYHDPDQWKPFDPSSAPEALALARKAFHQYTARFGSPCICPDSSLRTAPKGYRSNRGNILLAISVGDCHCDVGPDEFEWFLIRNQSAIEIDSSLTVIDAGDYDGDGSSEVLFYQEGLGDADDAYILLSLKEGRPSIFRIPGPYTF